MTSATDGQLLAAWRAGDAGALRDLMRRHEGELWRLAERILGSRSDAEDAMREALVRAYKNLDQLRDGDKFRPWAKEILRRVCSDHQRKWRAVPVPAVMEQAGPTVDMDGRIDIEDALMRIPQDQARLLYLVDVEDRKIEDVAVEYGVRSGAIRNRLGRARKRLGEEMGYLGTSLASGSGRAADHSKGIHDAC